MDEWEEPLHILYHRLIFDHFSNPLFLAFSGWQGYLLHIWASLYALFFVSNGPTPSKHFAPSSFFAFLYLAFAVSEGVQAFYHGFKSSYAPTLTHPNPHPNPNPNLTWPKTNPHPNPNPNLNPYLNPYPTKLRIVDTTSSRNTLPAFSHHLKVHTAIFFICSCWNIVCPPFFLPYTFWPSLYAQSFEQVLWWF